MTVSEQFAATQQSALGHSLNLTATALNAVEKIALLNMQAVKATLSEQQALADRAVVTRDVSELIEMHSGYVNAFPLKVKAYWEHVTNILADAQRDATASAPAPFMVNANLSPWKAAFVATEEVVVDTAQDIAGSSTEAADEATRQLIVASDAPIKH